MGYNVLVADDEAGIARLVVAVLSSQTINGRPVSVQVVSYGAAAIAALKSSPKLPGSNPGTGIDLVITDGSMPPPVGQPSKSGIDVVIEGRAASPGTKYVLTTGEVSKYKQQASELGVPIVEKPFSPLNLLNLVCGLEKAQ